MGTVESFDGRTAVVRLGRDTDVAAMRGVGSERMASVAEGRVWRGRQALDNGLVDKLGGIDEAVEKAAAGRAKA